MILQLLEMKLPTPDFRFSPEHHKLAMAQEFVLTKECECFINSSTVTIDTSTNSDITIISDSSDSSESTIWKKIDHFHLYHQDHSILLSRNAWLNDNHVNCAQYLLKKQFTHLYGLRCSVLQQSQYISPLSQESLQILHVSSNHWIALSTLQCSTTNLIPTACLYDSLYRGISMDTQTLLAKFLANGTRDSEQQLSVAVANVAQQSGASDCGLFAIAFVTHLAHSLNPCYCNFKQNAMREHFLKCIDQATMTPFPTNSQRTARLAITKEIVEIQLYCYCRLPDNGSKMVECESSGCKLGGWFHLKCVNAFEVKKNNKWICNNCRGV